MGHVVGLGGLWLNIDPLYALVSRTGYWILDGCCCRIRRILIKYCMDRVVGLGGLWSDIHPLYALVSRTRCRIFIHWMYWSGGLGIEYCMNVAVELGGLWLNIQSVNELASRTGYQILYGCWHRIRRIRIGYSLSVWLGQPDRVSNIVWMLASD